MDLHELLDPTKQMEIRKYESDKEAQKLLQTQLREFIETKPLYSVAKMQLPPLRRHFHLEVAQLDCDTCRTSQPFRRPEYESWYHFNDKNLAQGKQHLRGYDRLMNGIFPIELECQGCKSRRYYFFVHTDVDHNRVTKFGQIPMWLPKIEKDIAQELGPNVIFYQRALRCLNESFGIGACAYFRRMLENYINPLLKLLHDYKAEQGADDAQLKEIQDVIASKDFSAKTRFASQICPESIIVKGMNPLKKLHELLSYNLHTGNEKEATEIATQLRTTIEYVIRQLRRRYEEQKEFIETMKGINKINTEAGG